MKRNSIMFIVLSGLLASCEHKAPPEEKEQKYVLSDTMKHMIVLDTAQYCTATQELSLSGEVSFNDNNVVKVFPRSSGQVIDAKVSLGDRVTKGQVLAVIRSADVAGNYSDLSSANADVAIAKREMDNQAALYKNGIASEKEYSEAKQNYEKAMATKGKAQSIININGGGRTNATGEYIVTAPIDGFIVEKKVTTGAFIRPDMGDNLFTISDLKNVWIYANVYEADIPKIKEGYSVRVIPMSYPDKDFIGKIDKVSQVLDPQSKAMRVRITLDNKEMLLKPDMFAKVIVDNAEGEKSICIPTKALIPQDGKNYVIVYNNDSDLKVAQINVLRTVNDRTYITDGLTVGQTIVSKNQILIFNQLLSQ